MIVGKRWCWATLCVLACVSLLGRTVLANDEPEKAATPNAATSIVFDSAPKEGSNKETTEHHQYKAHVSRFMNLIVHSMYANSEVFVRELLANGCDAIDKLLRGAMNNPDLLHSTSSGNKIIVTINKEAQTLSFKDTGIGMTKDDLKEYLGTIAKSGTAETIAKLSDAKDASTLIGQFGVGFYSAFLVASEVAVASKNDKDSKQWLWRAAADSGDFSIEEDPRGKTMERGTEVILHIKPDATKYLDQDELKKIIEKYVSFYPYSIYLQMEKTVETEVDEEEEKAADDKEKEEKKDVEVTDDEESSKKTKKTKVKTLVKEDVLINNQKPLWMRDQVDVTKEEYVQMYKTIFKESGEPLAYTHFSVDGDFVFRGILFIPRRAPFNAFSLKDAKNYIHLYVRRSYVTDKLEDFLPPYLSFVKGIVDSDDLPLNISRESLQNAEALRNIKSKVINKIFEMIRGLADEEDKANYKTFYETYGSNLKLEASTRENYRSKIAALLRFESNKSNGQLVSLDEYVSRKKEGQKTIYFMAGQSKESVSKAPFLEKLLAKEYEILYMVDPVDEQTVRSINKFKDMEFQNVASDGLKLDEDSETIKAQEEEYKPLMEWLKKTLSSDVESVRLSSRLVSSPCAVVASQFGWTGNMERVILAQSSGKEDPMMSFFANQKKIFEINPDHVLIKSLLSRVKNEKADTNNSDLEITAKLLYDSTLVHSGYMIKDTGRFSRNVDRLARKVLGIKEEVAPEPAKEKKEGDVDMDAMSEMLSKMGSMEQPHDDADKDDDADEAATTASKNSEKPAGKEEDDDEHDEL